MFAARFCTAIIVVTAVVLTVLVTIVRSVEVNAVVIEASVVMVLENFVSIEVLSKYESFT